METLDKILSYLNRIEGLPGVALVFLSCIIAGYVWRCIPWKWFPNSVIPIIVILWGAFAQSFMADARASAMPFRVWFLRNVIVGSVIGFIAWLTHNLILTKVEDWLLGQVPRLGDTMVFRKGEGSKPPDPPPPPPPPDPPIHNP